MKFTVYIHDTNDGSQIAKKLRELAGMVDGHPLNDGFQRVLDGGLATMDIEVAMYDSCAEAERKLGMILDWQTRNKRHEGYAFGRVHACVEAKEDEQFGETRGLES